MNNIYKKLSVILMLLSMVVCFKLMMDNVSAELWGNYVGAAPCNNCNDTTYSSSSNIRTQNVIAVGYCVSVINYGNGKLASYNKSVTHSVDYWPESDNSYDNTYFYRGFSYLSRSKDGKKADSDKNKISRLNGQKLQYCSTKYPKTMVKDNCNSYSYTSYKLDAYNQWDFIVEKNHDLIKSKTGIDISNGQFTAKSGGNPGDTRYNNNYAKFALIAMEPMINGSNKDGSHSDSDYLNIAKLLKNCGYGNNKNSDDPDVNNAKTLIQEARKDNVILAVEPVIALSDGSKYNNTNTVYVGTQAELAKMDWTTKTAWSFPKFSYLHPVVYAYSPNGMSIAGIKTQNGLNVESESNYRNALDPHHSLGIYLFSIAANFDDAGCADVTTQYIDTVKNDKDFMDGIKKKLGSLYDRKKHEWLLNFNQYGFTLETLKSYLQKPGKENCQIPDCSTAASNLLSNKANTVGNIISMLKTTYDDMKKFDSNTLKDKNNNITNLESKNMFNVTSGNNLCDPISCSSILEKIEKNEANLKKLYDKFGFDRLNSDFLEQLYKESETDTGKSWLQKASCNPTPTCGVEMVTASCQENGKNTFTLQDTPDDTYSSKNEDEKCLKSGIAYNALKNADGTVTKQTVTQTSYDSTYGKNAYCWESVEFTFPTTEGENYNVISGELLKWGTNTDKKNSLFGKMKVTRKCHVAKNTVKLNWAKLEKDGGRINPVISIYYKPAIPSDAKANEEQVKNFTVDGKTLDVQLNRFIVEVNGEKSELVTDMYNCGGSCENKKIEMIAEYNLNYGNSLKWYSSTPTSINKKNEIISYEEHDKIIDDKSSSYVWMGYGLPTTYLTPTNVSTSTEQYGKYEYSSTISGETSGRGHLYATVSNIGTKNRNNDNYHFDKLVQFAIKDDNEKNDDNFKGKIFYNCEYRVKNNLFDTESGDGDDFETPKGIDVVFRTVDLMNNTSDDELNRAFPGMSGKGITDNENSKRQMGANWNEIYNDGVDGGTEKIFNILKSSIYSEEPMYYIELNVSNIQSIRQYNKSVRSANIEGNEFDPYTSMPLYDYSDSNVTNNGYLGYICRRTSDNVDESAYRYCASNFLTKLKEDNLLKGSCIENAGSTSDRANSYKQNGCLQER